MPVGAVLPEHPSGMTIRGATAADLDAIRSLLSGAFPPEERDEVVRLAIELLLCDPGQGVISLVAEEADSPIALLTLSPVTLPATPGQTGAILSPLAVRPSHQRQGIGSGLVAEGLRRLADRGSGLAFVYGDPRFYGRFGFRTELARGVIPPCGLRHPEGWQALRLGAAAAPPPMGDLRCLRPLCREELW